MAVGTSRYMGGFGQWIIARFIWALLSSLGLIVGGWSTEAAVQHAPLFVPSLEVRTGSSFVRYSASISREMWQGITQENRSSSDNSDKVSPSTWKNLFDSCWRPESSSGMARYVIRAIQGGQMERVKVTRPWPHDGTCEAARHGMVEDCRKGFFCHEGRMAAAYTHPGMLITKHPIGLGRNGRLGFVLGVETQVGAELIGRCVAVWHGSERFMTGIAAQRNMQTVMAYYTSESMDDFESCKDALCKGLGRGLPLTPTQTLLQGV
ncbi:hypothetical protein L204_101228 [Cryptococcus depauperatus]